MVKTNEEIVVLKFSEAIKTNCMEEHIRVIEEKGFCWYGKVGKSISEKIINLIMNSENRNMLFYKKNGLYIAKVEAVTDKVQVENVPEYYKDLLYSEMNYPNTFFKISKLKPIELAYLDNFNTTTGKRLSEAIVRCMNPVIVAKCVKNCESIEE